MKSVIFCFLLLSPCSCTPYHNEVYYSFEDVVIKRIDDMNRTTLFYLENGVPVDTVWTTYSGFTNSWFNSHLCFLPDNRVLVVDNDSYWYRRCKVPNKFLYDRIDCPSYFDEDTIYNTRLKTYEYWKKLDSLAKDGRSYRIVLTDMEQERDFFNKDNTHTRVRVSKSLPETSY